MRWRLTLKRLSRFPDPHQHIYHTALWDVFLAYLEWRSVRGCPKSLRMPEEVARWEYVRGVLSGVPAFCNAKSSRPRSPGALEEFGVAFNSLEEYQAFLLLDLFQLRGESKWLMGQRWRRRIRQWKMSPSVYETLLWDAWWNLKERYRRRNTTIGRPANYFGGGAG